MIEITTYAEYEYLVNNGYQPLRDWKRFVLDMDLRLYLQYELFGSGDFQQQNQKFYEWVWKHSIHCCEETGKPLYNYSSVYISHIISRGSDRRLAIDPRNINILSYKSHNNWEFGNRNEMNIYPKNKFIIELLKKDYNFKK